MNQFVDLALYGWPLVVLFLFLSKPVERALCYSLVLGFLFLPEARIFFEGMPDIDKQLVSNVPVFFICILMHLDKFKTTRLSWVDLPMAAWLTAPLIAAVTNGQAPMEGVGVMVEAVFNWGMPYWLGRVYLNSREGLYEIVRAMTIGMLIYIPLILIESRMSPQMNVWVYGYHQHEFQQVYRWGGYRPMVFLQHGLVVAVWTLSCAVLALWNWRYKVSFGPNLPSAGVLALLFSFMILMCRSLNGVGLFLLFLPIILVQQRRLQHRLIVLLACVPLLYVSVRVTDTLPVAAVTPVLEQTVGAERTQSMTFRLEMEDRVKAKAMEKPLFGWSSWGTVLQSEDAYGGKAILDGLWIIAFGFYGLYGLLGMIGLHVFPVVRYLSQHRGLWDSPKVAPGIGLVLVLVLGLINNMLNHTEIPILIAALGALGQTVIRDEATAEVDIPKKQWQTRYV